MGTMEVIVIETPQLGDRSYLVHDGSVALVIDPQRDTDRVEAAAAAAGVVITHVAETHVHNDYLSGGLELARAHHASYLVNAADPVAFERAPITGGQTVKVGSLTVKAVATPGPHPHAPVLHRRRRREAGRLLRRKPALRLRRPHGPRRRHRHGRPHPRPVRLRTAPRRRGRARRRAVPDPRLRLVLLLRARRRARGRPRSASS